MGRDSLSELSETFTSQGFQLTPLAHHNLGSSNRLIMLDSSYIELLGWEKGKPIQRAEIANQAIGLDALVFRTNDADASYAQLKESGFAVNPVQDLSREGEFMGKMVLVEFKTVRFSEQPIPGLRIYFCEHLNPEYVWQKAWLSHPNKMHYLPQITLGSPDSSQTAATFQKLLNLSDQAVVCSANTIQISLPNIELHIQPADRSQGVFIQDARLSQSPSDPVDFIIDHHFLPNTRA
jgi:hypothetical protein